MLRRFSFFLVVILALALMPPSPAPAASFPDRDITLVCPWAAENMKEIGWTGAMKTRWRDAKSINGRDRIRLVLIKLGFTLD